MDERITRRAGARRTSRQGRSTTSAVIVVRSPHIEKEARESVGAKTLELIEAAVSKLGPRTTLPKFRVGVGYRPEISVPKDVIEQLETTKSGRKIILRFREDGKRNATPIYLDEVQRSRNNFAYRLIVGNKVPSVTIGAGVRNFILYFADNIRKIVCPKKGAKPALSHATSGMIGGLSAWITSEFGIHLAAAVALAATIAAILVSALKGAFCDMTRDELTLALKRIKSY